MEGALEAALERFEPDPASAASIAAQKAVHLARLLQARAAALQTPQERKQQAELERMMQSPHEKATLTQLTDQAFRSESAVRAADQLTHILDVQGVPRFFTAVERTLLKGFQSFGSYLPGVAVPLVKDKMREETANVILPAERELLSRHLNARRESGMRMNVNFLGEALLGEEEAEARLESYLEALQLPEIEVLSVKISTIYSQISSLAFEDTVAVLCDRLELLYRAAAKMRFTRLDGTVVPKFVYLDMEEYRDLNVTAEAFMQTLDREGLEQVGAGIALQAYLPDSFAVQKRINAWARRRVAAGGAPITVRLVKGANMEMERVEASIRGWPQAPFGTKGEVDANYKRMLHEGMRAENIAAVRLGIASHNLFDLAYGLVLAVGAAGSRPGPVRDARGHGQPPASGALRAHQEHASLRSGDAQGGLRLRGRVPAPPAGREHGSGQFPAPRLQAEARRRRLAAARGAVPGILRADRWSARGATPHPEPAGASDPSTGGGGNPGGLRQRAGHGLRARSQRRLGEIDHREMEDARGGRRHRDSPAGGRRGDLRRPLGARLSRSVASRRGGRPLSPGQRGGRRDSDRIRAPRRRRLAGDVSPEPLRDPRPGGPGDPRLARRPDGSRPGRRWQDPRRVRLRGFRGGGLSRVLQQERDGIPSDLQSARSGQGGRRGDSSLELSHRHPLWRDGGGARGGEQRDPQARIRRGAGGAASCAGASGARACRGRRCSSCPVRERRSGRGW